jgi:hypothetical protein
MLPASKWGSTMPFGDIIGVLILAALIGAIWQLERIRESVDTIAAIQRKRHFGD